MIWMCEATLGLTPRKETSQPAMISGGASGTGSSSKPSTFSVSVNGMSV